MTRLEELLRQQEVLKMYDDYYSVKKAERRAIKEEKYRADEVLRLARWEEGREAREEKAELSASKHRRLRRARKVDVKENYSQDDELYTRDLFGNKCARCSSKDSICIDHHYPLSRGHALTRTNAVLLCTSCNSSKGAKLPENFYTKQEYVRISETLYGKDLWMNYEILYSST